MTAAAPPVAIEPSSTQTPSSSKYHHYYPTSTAATTTTNNNNNSNHHQYQNQQQQQQSSSSPSGTPRRSTTATGSSKNANILGSYFMMQTIGEGEFAKVKLAVHRTAPHREVAIKLIRKDNLDTFEKRSKVEREILALRSVSHPNIVRMVDLLDTDRYIGIVMEYASGGELFDYILAHKYLREKDACRLFAQLMSGVAHLHARRIVHRDLKLENLLLDKQRNIIITDFGFANQFGEDGGVTAAMRAAANSNSPMSSGGNSADRARLNVALPAAMMSAPDLMSTSCGSPCYAAPELVLSEGMYVGTAADIWSCGVILYAMLAGFLPYDDDPTNPDSENISQLYQYIMTTPLVYPDHIPEQAKLLLQRILVPDPAKRAGVKEISDHEWLKPHAAMLANQKLICENFFPPVTMPSASAAGSRATSAASTPAVSPIAKPAPAVVTASQPVMPLPMSSSHAQSQSVTAAGSSRSEYATATATATAISSSSVSSSQPTTTHSGHGASSPSAIAAASYGASKPVESRVRTGPSTTRVPPTVSTASAPMPLLPPSPLQQQQQQQHKQIAAAFPPVPTNGSGLPSAASPSTRAPANGGGGGGGSSRPVSVISTVSVGGHERTRAMTIGSPPPQFQNLAAGFARPTAVTPTVAPVATTAASATVNGKAHRGSDTSAMNVANGGMSTCSSMMSVVPGPDFLYESPHVDSPPLPTMIVKQRAATSTSTSTAIVNNTSVADSGVQTASAESSAYHTALAAVTEVDDENGNDGGEGDSHQHQYQHQQQHRAADGERTDTDAGSSMAVECDDSAVFMVPCGDSTTSLVPIQQQQQQQLPSHNLQAPVQSRQSVSRPSTTSGKGTVIVRRREQSQSRPGQQQPSQNRFSIYGVVGSGMVLDLFRRGTSGVKQLASPSTEAAPNITITTEDSAAQLTAPYSPRPPSTVTQAVSIRQPLAVEPISDADDHRMAQRLLKIHTGPIDNSALTSLPPRKAFALVRQQVLDMGLVIVKERDFKIKVVRPIKPVLPSSSSAAQLNGGSGSRSRVTTAAAIAASAAVRAPGYLGESTLRILSSPILNAIRKPSSANQQSVEFALDDQQQQQQTVPAAVTTTGIKSRFGGFSLDLTRGRSIRGGGSGARVADSSQDQSTVNNALPSSIPMAQSQSNQQQSSTTSTSAFSFIGSTAAAARRATLSLIGGSANSRPATPALPSSPLRSGFRSATGNGGASTTLTAPSTPLIASTDMTFVNHQHQQSQLQSPTTQFIQPSSPLQQQQQHQQHNGVQFKDLSNPQSRIVTAPERQSRPLPPLPPLTAPISTANTLHGNEFTAGHVEGNNSAVSLLQKVQQSASTATTSTRSSVSAAINLRLTPPSAHAQQQQQQQQYSPVSPDDSDVSVKMSYGHTAGNNSGGGGGMSVLKRIFKFGSGSNASSSSVASNQTGRVVSNGGGHGRSRSDGHALFPSATTANVMTTTSSTGQISGGHPLQISISSASASQYHSTGSSSAPILTRSNSTNEDIVAIERHGTTPIPDPLALSSVHHHHHQRHGDSLDGKSVRSIPLAGGSDEDRTSSTSAAPVGCDYLYGPDKQDSGGQVVFVIELHAIKYLPEMYVVSLTRRKGQLSSYKYLYDTFLAKLDIRSQGPLLPCKSSAAAAAATASSAIATQSNISGVLGASSDAASAFNVPMSPQMQSPPAITTSISNNTRERRHEQHASAASSPQPQPQPRHPSGRAGAISPIPSGSGRTAGNSASRQRPATTMFSPSDLILLSNQHQGQVQQQYPYYNGGTIKRNSMMAPQMVSQYA